MHLDDVRDAARRLAGRVLQTPLVRSERLSEAAGRPVLLKLENRQHARCFKPRGALNAALVAASRGPLTGLLTFSSGNHGQAVALAAAELGLPCTVVSPVDVRPEKLAAMRGRGASVVLHGLTSAERMERAVELARETGWLLVPPYDHADVVAGQGTVGLELHEQAPADLEAVFVPVGGGGLVSGIATVLSELRPAVRIIGVEPEGADDARRSLAAGRLVGNDRASTSACDGLRNTRLGDVTWSVIQRLVAEIDVVSDQQVENALALLEAEGLGPIEPSGAAAAACVLARGRWLSPRPVIAIVSGGNAGLRMA